MTLDELDALLPNGLHDAKLGTVAIDFAERTVRLDLDIWVGDDEEREAYRRAQVILSGLLFWVSDPPDPSYSITSPGPLRIEVGPLTDKLPEKQPALPSVPPDAFANWLYVRDWNTFIYVAAKDASLTWLGDRAIRETAAPAAAMIEANFRQTLLLSVQRALLGAVPAALREVRCGWSGQEIKLRFVFDGEIDPDDYESSQIVGSEVIGDFPEIPKISEEIIRLDYPDSLNEQIEDTTMTLVYWRKER